MAEKKAVVKESYYIKDKETKQPKQDNYGNYTMSITFDNGDNGFFTTKYNDNKSFDAGKEVSYLIEAKPKKSGEGTWNKITLPPKPNSFQPSSRPVWQGKTTKEMKFEARRDAIELCVRMYIATKVDYEQMKDVFHELVNILDAKIDELNSES